VQRPPTQPTPFAQMLLDATLGPRALWIVGMRAASSWRGSTIAHGAEMYAVPKMAPTAKRMHDVGEAVDRPRTEACASALERCAAVCEQFVRADPNYSSSAAPFADWQLTLISLASICRLTCLALIEHRDDFAEMCAWCQTACEQLDDCALPPGRDGRPLFAAVRTCRELCAIVTRKC
jgi:hypothetical protein